jgi:DNA-directed RNA polymerase subunit RPC12/RpoP
MLKTEHRQSQADRCHPSVTLAFRPFVLQMTYLVLLWVLGIFAASFIAFGIVQRRGSEGAAWALLVMIGALGTGVTLLPIEPERMLGLIGFVLIGIGCIGFHTPRRRTDRCHFCGYDLRGLDRRRSVRCPESGNPMAGKEKHCRACGVDLHQTIARGGITCPECGEPIDKSVLPSRD